MSEGLIEGFERRRFLSDGVEIDALVGGSGPPLLFLHGFPQARRVWARVAPALADAFALVIPDLLGCERSGKPPGDAGHHMCPRRSVARDQVAMVAALELKRPGVAGHGRGGRGRPPSGPGRP